RPEGGCRIGCKERIAGSGDKNHNASFFKMSNCASPYERFSYLVYLYLAHHTSKRTLGFERVLECDAVHYRRQHSDGIGRRAVQAFCRKRDPAKNVAAADYYGDFNAEATN